jgi:hypothetical protein
MSFHSTRIARIALVSGLFANTVLAHEFCVADSGAFELALSASNGNGEPDLIRMQEGDFRRDNSTGYYTAVGPGQSLEISGGWNAGCNSQSRDPNLTQIHGDGLRRVLRIDMAAGAGNVAVSNLTIVSGQATSLQMSGGLVIMGLTGYTGDIRVERSIFKGNRSGAESGGLTITRGGTITVRGNLFSFNEGSTSGAVYINPGSGIGFVTNNTFAYNSSTQSSMSNPGGLRHEGAGVVDVVNNLFVGNSNGIGALDLNIPIADGFINNRYDVITNMPATAAGNTTVDPKIIDPSGNFRLRDDSPMIDAGFTPVPGSYALHDLAGQPRVIGGAIDIGAYEKSDVLFFNDFE